MYLPGRGQILICLPVQVYSINQGRKTVSPIILIAIYAALIALAAFLTDLRLRDWPLTQTRAAKLRRFWLTLFILLSLLPVAGAFLPNSPVKFALQAAGNIWLGFYLYFGLLLLVLLGLEQLVRRISGGRAANRWHGSILCVALTVALVVTGYGLVHAQNTVVERYDIEVDKPGEDMKMVLIGDLHLSVNSRLATTKRMVELINAEHPATSPGVLPNLGIQPCSPALQILYT